MGPRRRFIESDVVFLGCAIDEVMKVIDWLDKIPFTDWPQQAPIDGQLRPAMMNDLAWNSFGSVTDELVKLSLAILGGGIPYQRMLSTVMPNQGIDAHHDWQEPSWIGRIHIPLVTNSATIFSVGGRDWDMEVGSVYLINTEARHAVFNHGLTPRVHFMTDIKQ